MILALATATTLVAGTTSTAQPGATAIAPLRFAIATAESATRPRERELAFDAIPPRNLDLRTLAMDMPELIVPLIDRGPNLMIGALGGRGKGMPRLVHIGLGWRF